MTAAGPDDPRRDLVAIFDAAVAAVSPAIFLPPVLPAPPARGRLVILAAGKAAGSMAAAAEAHYLDRLGLPPDRLAGLAIARHGYGVATRVIEMLEAGHPVPDEAGLSATIRLMRFAETCSADDQVIFLASGGASANLVAPAKGLTLADKQAATRVLLKAGVPIDGINCIRKHISAIKGGRLARLIAPASLLTLALSDVPGDDLAAIGSGPSVPDPSTLDEARAVVRRYGVELPPAVWRALHDPANESPKPGDACFAGTAALVAARPADAFEAARQCAASLGWRVVDLGAELEGEAREVAARHAAAALAAKRQGGRIALLSGGELTVTIRGNGRGGPNQEYQLALALALGGVPGIQALAADTDGTDGGVGAASDPAGAFCDATTLARATGRGMEAASMLDNNDSTRFFAALGDLHAPGPTLTNANDLRIILVET